MYILLMSGSPLRLLSTALDFVEIIILKSFPTLHLYMLFAGWEVRMAKNCDRGLENTARGRRQQMLNIFWFKAKLKQKKFIFN